MLGIDVGQLDGHNVFDHDISCWQTAAQQLRHHIHNLLVQLGETTKKVSGVMQKFVAYSR